MLPKRQSLIFDPTFLMFHMFDLYQFKSITTAVTYDLAVNFDRGDAVVFRDPGRDLQYIFLVKRDLIGHFQCEM